MQVTVNFKQGPVAKLGLSFTPMVELLVTPRFHESGLRNFLRQKGMENNTTIGQPYSSDSMNVMETAGRVCYMSFSKPRPGGSKAYLTNILESGHGSVCEHANYSFLIHGTSRSLTHEHVRHRAGWGYSQLSQRFVGEQHVRFTVPPKYRLAVLVALQNGDPLIVTPEEMDDITSYLDLAARTDKLKNSDYDRLTAMGTKWLNRRAENLLEYTTACEDLRVMYQAEESKMEKTDFRKLLRQTARNCLPNATETYYVATANVRALRHFFEKRGNFHAEEEIRYLAVELARTLHAYDDAVFPDMTIVHNTIFETGSVDLKYPKV